MHWKLKTWLFLGYSTKKGAFQVEECLKLLKEDKRDPAALAIGEEMKLRSFWWTSG